MSNRREIEDLYRLLPLQEGMLFESLRRPGSGVYVVQLACRLEGRLDPAALERAWRETVDHHPVLRTSFHWEGMEHPHQVVHRRAEPVFRVEDWRRVAGREEAARFEALLAADRERGFDLARAPLSRILLLDLGEGRWRLLWTQHHLILDGWSQPLVLRELFERYRAAVAGTRAAVPSPPPFRGAVERFLGRDRRVVERFWRRQLAGFEAGAPGLPEPPAGAGEGVGRVRLELPVGETASLAALVRREGLTPGTVVQGAWALALSRWLGWTGAPDVGEVLFGVVVSGRPPGLPGVERMVGPFIDTVPLRVPVAPGAGVLGWLRRLRERLTAAEEHGPVPLSEVQGWAGLARDRPLFETVVAFENYPLDPSLAAGVEGLSISEVRSFERDSVPLALASMPGDGRDRGLELQISFHRSRFDGRAVRRLLDQVAVALRGLVAAGSGVAGRLAEVPVLPAVERHRTMVEWADGGGPLAPAASVPETFRHRASSSPDAPALHVEPRRGGRARWLSYGELARRVDRLAAALRAEGAGPEVPVAVLPASPAEALTGFLATLATGAVYVPLEAEHPPEHLAWILRWSARRAFREAGVAFLLAGPEEAARVEVPTGMRVVDPAVALAGDDGEEPGREPAPEAAAYLIYTSGSTGEPHGVAVARGSLAEHLAAIRRAYGLTAGDRVLHVHSLAFDASIAQILGALTAGACLVARHGAAWSTEELVDRLGRWRMTVAHLPTAYWREVARDLEPAAASPLPALRLLLAGGEAMAPEPAARWREALPGTRLVNSYGPTEAVVTATLGEWAGHGGSGSVPVGRPLPGRRAVVLDGRGGPAPEGAAGELSLGGLLARGYAGRPALTAGRFVPDPSASVRREPGSRLHLTGDRARWLPGGRLQVLGRLDDQVKVRGFRVEPAEAEAALAAVPGVAEAVVVARHGEGGAELVGFAVAGRADLAADALRAELAGRLPPYLVPSRIVLASSLPRTATGKVDRRELAAREPKGTVMGAVADAEGPRTPLEAELAAVWASVLGLPEVGRHDRFFDLGGHSLLAMQVVSRVRRSLEVELPMSDLFEHPTVAELARRVEARRDEAGDGPPPLVPRPSGGEGSVPASAGQERLWFLDRLDPGSAAYVVPLAVRLRGPLEPSALEGGLAGVVGRHESLRTTLVERAGHPVQVIAPRGAVWLPRLDLSRLPEPARSAEALRVAEMEALRPFELDRGPLLRSHLLRLGGEEHLLVLTLHHAVTDEWSLPILVGELAALYRGEGLDPLPVQYPDWALWQRAWTRTPAFERELAWWRDRLVGAPEVLDLPLDRPRPAVRTDRGDRVPIRLSPEVADGLRRMARERGATLFAVVLAAVQAWLRRLGAGGDVVVGTPAANRTHPETEGLIGFFINTVAVRTTFEGDPPLPELLDRVRRDAVDALSRQAVPYERVVEAVAPDRSLAQTPLLQVMLALHTVPVPDLELGGLAFEPVAVGGRTAKLDLLLELTDAGAGRTAAGSGREVAGALEYSADLFDRATVERLAGHLVRLVAGAIRDPERRLSELPLLSELELRQVREEWSGPERRFTGVRPLHAELAVRAAERPDAVAVAVDGRSVSYGELLRRSAALAARLRLAGVRPGTEERVGLVAERSVELVVGVVGILASGAAYVPVDPRYPAERRAYVLADAGVRWVVADPAAGEMELPEGTVPVRLATGAAPPADPTSRLSATTEKRALAYVIYTSGSTGAPKGVLVPHGAAARLFRSTEGAFGPGPDDVWTLFHSPAFDFSVWELWGALAHGGRLEVVPYWVARSPEALRRLLSSRRVTVLSQTPSAFRSLAAGGAPPKALRWIVFGGERLDPGVLHGWLDPAGGGAPGLRVANLYGITETTVHVTLREMTARDLDAPWRSPVGRPLPDLSVHVLDPWGRSAPVGVPGEVVVGGDGVARGYHRRPALTAERFVPDRFSGLPGARLYRSGDLARWLATPGEAGDLEYLGRIDQQVKVRGVRIEPGEVETALEDLDGVARAVVVARDDLPGAVGLVAYYVADDGAQASPARGEADLRAALGRVLPEGMVPARFVRLQALPLTPSGKVDRKALPAPERPAGGADGRYVAPRNDLERRIAAIWAGVLGAERVGIGDGFFDLGGHSLLATQVVSRMRDELGVEVPLRELFARPTVAALAEAVDRLRPSEQGAVPVRRDPDDRPLSPAQERLWFLDRFAPGTAALNVPVALRLAGRFDLATLAGSLAALTRRHEVLRSSYREEGGRPVQVVHPPAPVPVPVVDLAGLPPSRRGAEAEGVVGREARRPFRVSREPLLRVLLVTLGARERVLHLTLHHLVTDGWSLGILVRELTALYRARCEGRAADLPELRIQYADYARWLRDRLERGDLQEQAEHWRRSLAGAPLELDLPTDHPRPPERRGRGGRVARELPEGLSRSLRELARSAGASPFMALLAALGLLLGRWSGQEEVVVGSPVAGRIRRELEGLAGLFLNHLALRVDLRPGASGVPTFRDLLSRARATALEGFEHQEVPFERVLDAVFQGGWHRRDLSRTPVFQVYLNVLNFPVETVSLPGLTVEPWATPEATGTARFDLELYVGEPEGPAGRFHLELSYDADLYDRWRAEEMLEQLEGLLARGVERPDDPAPALPLMTERARSVLPDPASPLSAAWAGSIHERLERWGRAAPDRVAVSWHGGAVSYRRLADAAEAVAGLLAASGVGRGDRVAIRAQRGPALAAAVLGALRSGASFLLLDPAHPPARNALCLVRARPRAWLDLAEVAGGDPLPGELAAALDALPDLRVRRRLPPLEAPGAWPGREVPAASGPPARVEPDDTAYLAFTSGSTGEPKGVVGLHRSLTHFLPWQEREMGLSAGDRFSLLSGLAHDPLHRDLFTPLWVGGTVVVPDAERLGEPGWLAAWAASERVTVTHLTPALGRLLAEAPVGTEAAAADLRWALFVGDVLTVGAVEELRRLAPAARVVNLYGATETQRAVGWREVGPGAGGPGGAREVVPLGQGLPDVQLLVRSPGGGPAGGLTGIGEVGEVHVRSPHLAAGYLDDPRLTAERFVPHDAGWGERLYRTGDLGRFRGDGAVDPRGRADRQVQVRGFRVEPGEVEAALECHPAVRRAAVVDRDGADGRSLVAYVVPAEPGGAVPDGMELRRHLSERLPAHMIPAAFVVLNELPLTPNRKLDRAALPEPPEAVADASAGSLAGDPVAEVVAGLWGEVLEVERLGADSDFFALGGHSLQVTRVLARVRDALGVELPVRSLFEHPTVAAFARRVEAARRAGAGDRSAPPPLEPAERGPDGEVAASFSQERLWFLHRLDPESPAYHLRRAVVLRGGLEVPALGRAMTALWKRHEALRTALLRREGGLVQRVSPAGAVPLPVVDLRGLRAERRGPEAGRVLGDLGRRPFDLARPPLARALLVRVARREHRFGLVLHHAVTDGWSMGLLVRDLAALYRQEAEAGLAGLPSLPLQYPDYAAWQRRWLRGEVLERELAWWRERLDPPPEPLELPVDRRRPGRPSHRAHRVPVAVPPEVAGALRTLARGLGATPFMVLLAAFQAVLGRWTGNPAPAVGTPVTNRRDARLEGVVGFFVNTLVLASRLDDDPPFRELVARVREDALGAFAHQDVPFERLVEDLRPARDRSRSPLFQVVLALQNVPRPPAEPAPGLTVEPVARGDEATPFELTVSLAEAPSGGIAGVLAADADLFDSATAARLAGHFGTLLAPAVSRPGRRLSALPLLAPGARHQVVIEWPRAGDLRAAAAAPFRTLHGAFFAAAAARPDAVALVQGGRAWSYGALAARAWEVGGRLRALLAGTVAEPRVGIALERSPEQVAAVFGALHAGAAYVPLGLDLPAERLADLAARAALDAVVAGPGEPLAGLLEIPTVRVPALPRGAGPTAAVEAPEVPGESLAYVLFTSGSTGAPKGVMVSHRSAAHFSGRAALNMDLRPGSRRLQHFPLSFDASVADVFPVLGCGGTLVLREPGPIDSLERLLDLCAAHRVEVMGLPTALWHELAASEAPLPPSIRQVNFGGEAALAERVLRWRRRSGSRVILLNAYGPTETTVAVATAELSEAGTALAPSGEVPLGRADAGQRIHPVDRSGQPVPAGVAGELWIGGTGVARGYLDDPRLTAERFVPDPFPGPAGARVYRSGDVGRSLPDGVLVFLGRLDRQVKVRGVRVEPGEVESALVGLPAVREAAVGLRRGPGGVGVLVAWVVADGDRERDREELRTALARRLPPAAVPSAFVALAELPKTASGKVDRRALPSPPPETLRRAAGGEPVPPRTALEREIAVVWGEVLEVSAVGVTDDYFALGGHSLLAVRLAGRLEERLGRPVPMAWLFEHPTVESLAAHVARHGEAPPVPTLVPLRTVPEGAKAGPPLVLVHPAGGAALCYSELAEGLGGERPVWGCQAPGLEGEAEPLRTVEALAERYLDELVAALGPRVNAVPVHVGGWSFGALVAFEMARRMPGRGLMPGVVLALDAAPVPVDEAGERGGDDGAPEPSGERREVELLVRALADVVPVAADDLLARDRSERVEHVVLRARELGVLPPGFDRGAAERLLRVFAANLGAARSYRPGPYPGRLVLIRAADSRHLPPDDPAATWRPVVGGAVEVVEVPGTHRGMVHGAAVRAVAAVVDAALEVGVTPPTGAAG